MAIQFHQHVRSVPAKDLAKITNLPLRTIYRWRNGENEPGAFTQGYILRVILGEMKPRKKSLKRKTVSAS